MTTSKILIVEDERIIAKGIEKRLRGMGYAVAGSASTGEDGVRLAAELAPDLVLMDINLGSGIDGVEAAELTRAQSDVPVVFLTAFSDDATIERAKLTGPYGYLLKPFEDRDLHVAIEMGLYRHQMERRLLENEQWLAATLASIGDGVIATDELGRVRFMNSLAEQMTGWTQQEVLHKDVSDVFRCVNEATREPVPNPILDALAAGAPALLPTGAILIDRLGVERPVEDCATPIRDVNGRLAGAVLVFRDITERRSLEEHLRQSQKMEAMGRLAGGVAHDFNNIMTVITGMSELLLMDPRTPQEQLDSIRDIHESGKRAAALTNQIMAFSRKQMLVASVLNLNTVVRDVGMMAKRLIGSNIVFETDLAPDLGNVKADATQLGQVIVNLAVNARDAMPAGGRLVLSTFNTELGEETRRQHPDVQPGRYAALTVTDNGHGMSKSVLDRIFEPYFTTKGLGRGTGLGLAIVHGIVKQSGGHIEASSVLGEGTTVRIYLPLIVEAPTTSLPETQLPAKGLETILLAEDDPMVMKMTRTHLQQQGYEILEAANGRDALALAATHQGEIHLLITDLVMPHVHGGELAARLTATRPQLKVLFVSGYTDDVISRQGVETGKEAFLQKPFGLITLSKRIREILDLP